MVRRRAAFPALAVVSLLVFGTHCSEHDIRFKETTNLSSGGNLANGGKDAGGASANGGSGGNLPGSGGILGVGGKNPSRGGSPGFDSGGRGFGGSPFGFAGSGGRFGSAGSTSGGAEGICPHRCIDKTCPLCDVNAISTNAGAYGVASGGSGNGGFAGNASVAGGGSGALECRVGLHCDPDCGFCVECVKSSDCGGNGRFKCDFLTARCMLECGDSMDCPWPTSFCDLPRHVCVECRTRDDCKNQRCDENKCVP